MKDRVEALEAQVRELQDDLEALAAFAASTAVENIRMISLTTVLAKDLADAQEKPSVSDAMFCKMSNDALRYVRELIPGHGARPPLSGVLVRLDAMLTDAVIPLDGPPPPRGRPLLRLVRDDEEG